MNRSKIHRYAVPFGFAIFIGLVWGFLRAWYGPGNSPNRRARIHVRRSIPGWHFRAEALPAAVRKRLDADRLVNGMFTNVDRKAVRVFSSQRTTSHNGSLNLFAHLPDVCWIASGWKLRQTAKECRVLSFHGRPWRIERRLFAIEGRTELVYFGGFAGGNPLPYRLDPCLSLALRRSGSGEGRSLVSLFSLLNPVYWHWVWESFRRRTPLAGEQLFFRISTRVQEGRIAEADHRLRRFLRLWIAPKPAGTQS